jgi:hypothetical protein
MREMSGTQHSAQVPGRNQLPFPKKSGSEDDDLIAGDILDCRSNMGRCLSSVGRPRGSLQSL